MKPRPPEFERRAVLEYRDPLEEIWCGAVKALGWRIRRGSETYASWDGKDTLTLSTLEEFDPDDNLGQMILHELCHALVAAPGGFTCVDWGLSNLDDSDLVYEQATQRLQAALSQPFGLREFMAVTTDHRPYWDALPYDTLREDGDPAVPLAQRAWERAQRAPFEAVLTRALEATRDIGVLLGSYCSEDSLWSRVRRLHPSGMPAAASAKHRCGSCAWFRESTKPNCVHLQVTPAATHTPFDRRTPACERFQQDFSEAECESCGACCREGFDLVEVEQGEPFLERHAPLVQRGAFGLSLLRPTGRCPMLNGGHDSEPYRCSDYPVRPRSCADFPVAGEACLLARRRVGLSR